MSHASSFLCACPHGDVCPPGATVQIQGSRAERIGVESVRPAHGTARAQSTAAMHPARACRSRGDVAGAEAPGSSGGGIGADI